jgi:hypothetical protein
VRADLRFSLNQLTESQREKLGKILFDRHEPIEFTEERPLVLRIPTSDGKANHFREWQADADPDQSAVANVFKAWEVAYDKEVASWRTVASAQLANASPA